MRKRLCYLAVLSCLSAITGFSAMAEPVDYDNAKIVASSKLISLQKSGTFSVIDHYNRFVDVEGKALFYIFELIPEGFIAVSAETDLPPVPAYSFTNGAGAMDDEANPLICLLKADLKTRSRNIPNLPQEIIQLRKDEWAALMKGNNKKTLFQQWPPEGTTTTGGWLGTNWTQDGVYDDMCPMDPVTHQRSLAGCPATTMAQILNYYENINDMFFTDADDYDHNYAGRNFRIDDNYAEMDFPSFPVLNAYLDSITLSYASSGTLKNPAKAALTFACGVAAHQVYTSQGSGTFAVNQAKEAYLRFGFSKITFFDGTDTALYTTLSQNMMDARPAHLAVVDQGWTTGHNVVVDGYNTDAFYHLNFGWGGAYNGWYLLPEDMPYGLTVIEGLIADIAYPSIHTGISIAPKDNQRLLLNVYPNPAKDQLYAAFTVCEATKIKIEIYDLNGTLLISIPEKPVKPGSYIETMHVTAEEMPGLLKGLYICKLRGDNYNVTKLFIVR